MHSTTEVTEPKEPTGTEYDMWFINSDRQPVERSNEEQGRTPESLRYSEIAVKVAAAIFFLVCVGCLVLGVFFSKQS